MRRILSFISVFALLLTACEGDPGPQGPPGFDGRDGIAIPAAFEIQLDFTAPNYDFIEPYGFEVLPTDVTLVYISWDIDNGQDVWRLVPQTVIFDDGNDLVYNYDFTQTDVRFFLEGSNLDILGPEWTQAQVFRVVVVPADNIGRLDLSDLDAVMNMYGIEEFTRR
ncbi:hypothetical protein [Winogradskyella luteola]|uniref:Dihydrolipoamide dehydrogenase n=1 Tax=Winogradskyella luteola TaxID=2828330 RepID=A0A9X1FCD9_9FLAO|nr:hypothetical protein [Winogradskyella luteola]MBV7270508.1 hypothetical protein [Winogradskyella luteola]